VSWLADDRLFAPDADLDDALDGSGSVRASRRPAGDVPSVERAILELRRRATAT
jgi:hypothetical protein